MRKLLFFTVLPLGLLSIAFSFLNARITENGQLLYETINFQKKIKARPVSEKTEPIDPRMVQDQDNMTWDDYRPIPGKNWADPQLVPERKFRMVLVAVDFIDQPFVITLLKQSDLFGNPQIDPVKREDVARFYADFWLKPGGINHGQTINGYWMEQSRGKFGITALDAFGPYRMPKELWKYGLSEWGQNESTPDGSRVRNRMEPDVDSLWCADAGDLKSGYNAILRIYAGYDETGVWQEFGEMKFQTKEDIPAEWGNPNPDKPRWITTRYVPWTSWKAGQMQWGLSSIRQGENSGTITHELGHFAFDIGDNNNNPYIKPYRRVGSGPWDMMDRGSFNGPGGPHRRWVVPAFNGAAMPAGLMLRNRMVNGFIKEDDVAVFSREGLVKSGPAVVQITSRAVQPLPGTVAGMIVRLDGAEPHDRTPVDDPAVNPLSPGNPVFDFYSVEVVQRIGYDSFCPDNGVLIARNKDKEGNNGGPNGFNCFNWVIDAHPEDINMVDYKKPDGTPVIRTIADYRQLNDALFHAGLNSGSEFEYMDIHNRLHFYIIDIHRNTEGILSYTVGVRSLDSKNEQKREIILTSPDDLKMKNSSQTFKFIIKDNGAIPEIDPSLHPDKGSVKYPAGDIYRLSVIVAGTGWNAELLNELAATINGSEVEIPVHITYNDKCNKTASVTIRVISESNNAVQSTSTITLKKKF